MLKTTRFLLMLVFFSPLLISCDKDEENPVEENEEELITTVRLTLINNANTAETVTATWKDPEGDGAPVVTGLVLKTGTSYNGTVEFLDESNPAKVEDITEEIEEEDEEHEVFYTVSGAALSISRTDTDSQGLPVGLNATFTAATSGTGTLTVTLKHKPEGQKKEGDDVNVGSTDAAPQFPVTIQ